MSWINLRNKFGKRWYDLQNVPVDIDRFILLVHNH